MNFQLWRSLVKFFYENCWEVAIEKVIEVAAVATVAAAITCVGVRAAEEISDMVGGSSFSSSVITCFPLWQKTIFDWWCKVLFSFELKNIICFAEKEPDLNQRKRVIQI